MKTKLRDVFEAIDFVINEMSLSEIPGYMVYLAGKSLPYWVIALIILAIIFAVQNQ